MINKITSFIPNTLTCCNLLSGILACIAAFSGPVVAGPFGLTGFELAWLMIVLAAGFDFFDGFAARLLHAYSPMGKELDSLADLVSFGVAPGLLMFNLLHWLGAPVWVSYLSLIIPVCGALRLAKFNIDERQTTSFIGLPIPSNALFWIGYSAWLLKYGVFDDLRLWLTAVLIPAVSLLMVCELPMFSLKFSNMRWADNKMRFTMMAVAIILLIIFGVVGTALAVAAYIGLSVIDNCSRK
ncbi:MAG: CDP-diacylglycerol--serine O-phosphatidyltransferase [Bacteroidales bacterium]|nr:CDP-diacylglycerol--serine O-phosphatidyltransferase [Bacteroidales bacterium]